MCIPTGLNQASKTTNTAIRRDFRSFVSVCFDGSVNAAGR